MNTERLLEDKICTGCGACYNICPKKAISIKKDYEGFYKPSIEESLCSDCNLCKKVCPLNSFHSQNIAEPKAFAVQINDIKQVYASSSGGLFAVIAKMIIDEGGVVYGAAYDNNFTVCHIRSTNYNELCKLFKSKYVQSNTLDSFRQARIDLIKGKNVLFSGTPCQIAGLYSYLGKDYPNLFTIDLICHGVPSPKVFELYKYDLIKRYSGEEIQNIDLRNKRKGWTSFSDFAEITTNNSIHRDKKNSFMKLFLKNICINRSCSACQFNLLPRVGELTLGDFWGVDYYDPKLNNNKGLSIVLVNGNKGDSLLKSVKSELKIFEEVPLSFVVKFNPNIYSSTVPHKDRNIFFDDLTQGKSFSFLVKKYCKEPFYRLPLKFIPNNIKKFIKKMIHKMEN